MPGFHLWEGMSRGPPYTLYIIKHIYFSPARAGLSPSKTLGSLIGGGPEGRQGGLAWAWAWESERIPKMSVW